MSGATIGEFVASRQGEPHLADVIDGYLDGLRDHRDEYPVESNRTPLYRHGWLNGRDDRLGNPRASAAEIRSEYERLTAASSDTWNREAAE